MCVQACVHSVRVRVCVCPCLHTPANRLQSGLCTVPQGIKSVYAGTHSLSPFPPKPSSAQQTHTHTHTFTHKPCKHTHTCTHRPCKHTYTHIHTNRASTFLLGTSVGYARRCSHAQAPSLPLHASPLRLPACNLTQAAHIHRGARVRAHTYAMRGCPSHLRPLPALRALLAAGAADASRRRVPHPCGPCPAPRTRPARTAAAAASLCPSATWLLAAEGGRAGDAGGAERARHGRRGA